MVKRIPARSYAGRNPHAPRLRPRRSMERDRAEVAYNRLETFGEKDLIRIHESAARGQHRGTGVRNPAKVRRLVEDIQRYARKRRPIADILATVFEDIERGAQPFSDCNHRTAMHLGLFLAKQFGYRLRYSDAAGERLREAWASMSRAELKAWIEGRLVPLEGD